MKKYTMETFDAYEVRVDLSDDINEYALDFLKIFNTVKSNRDDLIRVTNDYNNGVYVVCTHESLEETKKYLSNFGEIKSVKKVLCMQMAEHPSYDYDEYEELVLAPYEE